MKKLLIDINSIVPYLVTGKTSGIGRTTQELIESLSKKNNQIPFEVSIYSQNMKGIGVKNLHLPFNKTHFYIPHRKFFNKLLASFPIKEWITQYDLMHMPHNFGYVYKPEKTLVTLHDALFMRIQENAFGHDLMREQVPSLMRKCKGIITCSKSSKKDIVETMNINPNKIEVVYWGINHNKFYPLPDKVAVKKKLSCEMNITKPFFLSVSCSCERKNTHKLIKAYIQLYRQNPRHHLVLVWDNPPVFVLKMIREANLENRIHFITNVSDQSLALLYNGATSLIFPSSYEGFGLPVIEAMACGTLVVCCQNSSLPEVGGTAALYMKRPSTEIILNYLEKFENNEIDINSYRQKCIKQAQKFQWGKTILEYIRIYQNHLKI